MVKLRLSVTFDQSSNLQTHLTDSRLWSHAINGEPKATATAMSPRTTGCDLDRRDLRFPFMNNDFGGSFWGVDFPYCAPIH